MNKDNVSKERIEKLFSATWYGNSLLPNSGAKLWNDGSVTILNQPPYELTIPINWLDDPYNHRSWRWILNAFQWMDSLLSKFKIDNDEQAIQKCVVYFFDWADFYIVREQEGEFLWKDDAVSFRTFRLAIIADYIFQSSAYSVEEKELTKKILQRHYIELADPKKFKSNNHGIFQMRALMSLMTIHPVIGNFEEVKEYVVKRLNWLWLKQYGQQNMHLENSTGYHQYIVEEFDQILKSPEFIGIRFAFNDNKIKSVKDNAGFLFHPNGIATLFGDSNFVIQEHKVSTGDHIFNEAGYAILAGPNESRDNSYLAIRTGFSSNAHRHSDDFSFEWSEKGQIIFQDSGRYSYDYSDPYRLFVSSSRAHNTVTVNDTNFPWWGDFDKSDFYTGAVSSYHGNSTRAELQLSKEFKSLGINFDRTFEIERGRHLRVVDLITSQHENLYEQWFHLSEDFEYLGMDDNERLVFESKVLRIEVITPKDTEVIVTKGQENPNLQGWVSYSEKKILARWSFGFKARAKSFRFNTKIMLSNILDT